MNGRGLYSPKIKDDLIVIIYRKAKLLGKSMTQIVDEILRPELTDQEIKDDALYSCHSCKSQVDIVFDNKGYCEFCESVVFVDRL